MSRRVKINSATAREFLFFLLFTTVISGLIKLSKSYTTEYDVGLVIRDLPLNRNVSRIEPSILRVTAESSGFSLLANSFESPKVTIAMTDMEVLDGGKYRYNIDEHSVQIKQALGASQKIISTSPKQVHLYIDSLSSKKVSVKLDISVNYGVGYGVKGIPKITPDSITIVGPTNALNSISSIATENTQLTEISGNINQTVPLRTTELPEELKFSTQTITYTQEVAKYTEGTSVVPITILGDPGGNVKILPKTAEIHYTVMLEDYDNIVPSDFLVTCDYRGMTANSNYLPLKVAKQPKSVKAVRLENKQVKFIVIN